MCIQLCAAPAAHPAGPGRLLTVVARHPATLQLHDGQLLPSLIYRVHLNAVC